MSGRKNIFAIARYRSTGDEDQLTQLLAYLIQERPAIASTLLAKFGYDIPTSSVNAERCVAGGRLDLEFEAPRARIVVESKLGAKLGADQCEKYIDHLATRPEPLLIRSLVKLTKLHEPWPEGIEELAAKRNVELVARRWWDVTSLLRRTGIGLAIDFAEMLEDEGIVVPGPLTEDDWADPSEIPPAASALVAELRGKLAQLSTGFRRQAIFKGRDSGFRSLYCLAFFERAQIGPGLAARWEDLVLHRRLKPAHGLVEGPVIACSVLNPLLSVAEQRKEAEKAVSLGGSDVVGSCHGKFPTRATSATSVLTAPDFLGQVEQAVEYARATVEHFRQIKYLTDMPQE